MESNSKNKKKGIKPLEPAEAARIIIDGMEKNKYSIFVGNDSKLMDLFYRISSKRATKFISKQMESILPDQ